MRSAEVAFSPDFNKQLTEWFLIKSTRKELLFKGILYNTIAHTSLLLIIIPTSFGLILGYPHILRCMVIDKTS